MAILRRTFTSVPLVYSVSVRNELERQHCYKAKDKLTIGSDHTTTACSPDTHTQKPFCDDFWHKQERDRAFIGGSEVSMF
jgi:hypothetical protein